MTSPEPKQNRPKSLTLMTKTTKYCNFERARERVRSSWVFITYPKLGRSWSNGKTRQSKTWLELELRSTHITDSVKVEQQGWWWFTRRVGAARFLRSKDVLLVAINDPFININQMVMGKSSGKDFFFYTLITFFFF